MIVIHCSATPPSQDIGVEEIDQWHRRKGWNGCGYHLVIRRDGTIEFGEHLSCWGAHVYGHNSNSVGVCLVGGVDEEGRSECNFTEAQSNSLAECLRFLDMAYGHNNMSIVGHRDLSPDVDGDGEVDRSEWLKDCPCFNVLHFLAHLEMKFY